MTDYKKLCNDLRVSLMWCGVCSIRHVCKKETESCKTARMSNAADAIEDLQAENDRLKKQLEAAVEDLRKLVHEHCTCYACINDKFDCNKETCTGCQYNGWNNWQWRGEEEKNGDTDGTD